MNVIKYEFVKHFFGYINPFKGYLKLKFQNMNRPKFKQLPARRAFYQNSPIPTLTNIANTQTNSSDKLCSI